MALGLLTRIPVPVDHARATARGAQAAWAWPLAGALVGALGALAATVAGGLGLPAAVAAGFVLAVQAMVTGAMHEDGLADSCDGLWGGHSRERRLEIMKDSRTGVFGVIGLVVVLGLRWVALAGLIATGCHWAALIAAGALSRAPMVVLMAALPPARAGGLSRSVGRPGAPAAWAAVTAALVVAVLAAGPASLAMTLWAGIAAAGMAAIARAKIGGQTGDILGASQQLAEVTVLLTALSLWT